MSHQTSSRTDDDEEEEEDLLLSFAIYKKKEKSYTKNERIEQENCIDTHTLFLSVSPHVIVFSFSSYVHTHTRSFSLFLLTKEYISKL